jgi:Major Facilitator Superfamily
VPDDGGWRPLRTRPATLPASPFARLALTHALSVGGDTMLTMALAGSLFFNVSPHAAKGKVALYLALTMAPFAVVAPLLGPLLDRSRGGRRLLMIGGAAARAVVCWQMASDLHDLALYPEAFAFLVLSKTHSITKSALVPAAVTDADELVEANSKLQLVAVAVGVVVAVPGVIVIKTVGAGWLLRLAALTLVGATVAALRIRPAAEPNPGERPEHRAELHAAGIRLAATAMGLLRGIVGFLTFLLAFGLRRGPHRAPSWWFGIVLAASLAGTLVAALAAPRLRARVREEWIIAGALAGVAVAGLVASRGTYVRPRAALMAAVVATAAGAAKLAFDSLVQRDAPDAARGRSFARYETRFQLLWVVGAFIPVVVPIPMRLGFVFIAAAAAFGAVSYWGGRRAAERRRPRATT